MIPPYGIDYSARQCQAVYIPDDCTSKRQQYNTYTQHPVVQKIEYPHDLKLEDLKMWMRDDEYKKLTNLKNNFRRMESKIERIQRLLATNSDIYDVKEDLYSLLEELGISFKKTRCKKCLWDYYNIIREELGIIPDASEESDFNQFYGMEFIYLKSRPVAWNGHIMDNNTDPAVIRAFLKTGASGYYRLNDKYDKNKIE